MFEIDGSHIERLGDEDLRTLVARLCEAELRRADLPVSAVTAGGHQDAPDGGIDVRIALPDSANPVGFIPRRDTGFQVKKSAMPRAAIIHEMRPKEKLREAIRELADASGAYIIVSSGDSCTDSVLEDRNNAMREAVADLPNRENLTLDFYDRDRLARWVREHHGLIAWVWEKIGQPIQGWRAYGDWAQSGSEDADYLHDDTARLHDSRHRQQGGVSVAEGIRRIRELLDKPRGVVRLVGLSGTGKTRLVQALFDGRVGGQGLDRALAHYTDEAESPTPRPHELMRRLIHDERRAIVIVDNCLPTTHRSLTAICTEATSRLSLITVEFDVGEDEPEDTEVFRLESASADVIENLIERRFPEVSHANRQRIAELSISGGNARMALALARTVERGESIAKLTDIDLFKRLFHQRQARDDLLKAAEVCSLVYSFELEAPEGDSAELALLAGLARISADELYELVAELYRRGLVQKRGRWRAVLPQALALWLARRALENIQPHRLEITMRQGPPRLFQSFSRRLGYLHDSEKAQMIVRGWLSPEGLLGNLEQVDRSGRAAIFHNIAPVLPEMTLACLERSARNNEGSFFDSYSLGRGTWISIAKSLAYDQKFFERAAMLLVQFICAETEVRNYHSARKSFVGLFQLYLSGTHATLEQRLGIIETLLNGTSSTEQELAMDAFDSLLISKHFSSTDIFDFGAHPRDYGWQPKTYDEINVWYISAINFAKTLIAAASPCIERLKAIFARRFLYLWVETGLFDELEILARQLREKTFWPEGWIAVRQTLQWRDHNNPPPEPERLQKLAQFLAPKDILQKLQLLFEKGEHFDLIDSNYEDEKALGNPATLAESLGREIATNQQLLEKIIPKSILDIHCDIDSLWAFGRGLASGSHDISLILNEFSNAITKLELERIDITVIRGFLEAAAERQPLQVNHFLDAAVADTVLGPLFPRLQTAIAIDEEGERRLEDSLKLGLAPIDAYYSLGYKPIAPSTLCKIISQISYLPDGFNCATHIYMRLIYNKNKEIDSLVIQCGRSLLAQANYDWQDHNQRETRELAKIADMCLAGAGGSDLAALICQKILASNYKFPIYFDGYAKLLESLFRTQPETTLNELIGDNESVGLLSISDDGLNRQNPLKSVPKEILLNWAGANPQARCLNLASVIPLFEKTDQSTKAGWSDIALQLLDLAPDTIAVLAEYSKRFGPIGCYSGSRADIWERYRTYTQALFQHPNPQISTWARQEDIRLAQIAEQERASERQTEERFE